MVRCLHQSAEDGKNEIGKFSQTRTSEQDREIKKCLKCAARDAKGKNALAGWRNRHTHLTQNQALARACGFDSRPGHHKLENTQKRLTPDIPEVSLFCLRRKFYAF